jgi:hypothetical protein
MVITGPVSMAEASPQRKEPLIPTELVAWLGGVQSQYGFFGEEIN